MTHPVAAQRERGPWARAWRVLRWPLGGLAALLLLIVAVALAWVLSNLSDAKPQALPPELAVAPPALPDERNAAWALIGLDAAPGRDAAQAGRALWRHQVALGSLPLLIDEGQRRAHQQAEQSLAGDRIKSRFEGPPLACPEDVGACVSVWLANPAAVAAQRAPLAEFGRRCEALVDAGFGFEEPLPPAAVALRVLPSHDLIAAHCMTWFRSGAAQSLAAGQRGQAVAQLARADTLWRGLYAGSRTLSGQMLALRLAQRSLDTLATLAAHDAALAPALLPLLAPPPDALALIRRWVPVESSARDAAFDDIANSCLVAADVQSLPARSWLQNSADALERWLCRHHIGLQPERTKQRGHDQWLSLLSGLQQGVEARLRERIAQAGASSAPDSPWWSGLTWVNTQGSLLIDLGSAAYEGYLPRHADLALRHEVVRLLVSAQAQGVPAAERAAWSARQDLGANLRERLSWADGGRTMIVRTWAEDSARPGPVARRDAIRISWPE